jgi:cyanophycin synthetase
VSGPPPFDGSRRLTGPNRHFAGGGAVLEAAWPDGTDVEEALGVWSQAAAAMMAALGWPAVVPSAIRHPGGANLAIAAPPDQWLTATHVNEWAWLTARGQDWTPTPDSAAQAELPVPARPPVPWGDFAAALARLRERAQAEAEPALVALHDAARAHGVPLLLDGEAATLGTGRFARHWPRAALPAPAQVPWATLGAVPCALVTGTNGKTTTVRLLTAMARAAGCSAGHNSTDGVRVDDRLVEGGDCAGPDGARRLLREPVDVAIVEAARGGLLRRGLAIDRADVALVTNIGDDHLGEYGIATLDDLAQAKLIVARAVDGHAGAPGTLVLNADDPLLRRHGPAAAGRARVAWFALDDTALADARAAGCATASLRDGRLGLDDPATGQRHDLGEAAALPLAAGGHARYNLANLLGAALAAQALGLPLSAVRDTLATFGARRADNPGRLAHWTLPGPVHVFVDFAHNPDGLAGLLTVARGVAGGQAPLRLVLGQAGNRTVAELDALAAAAVRFDPVQVVVKELPEYARGRPEGEVTGLLRDALRRHGLPESRLQHSPGELPAAQAVLQAAVPGDVVVLPVHGKTARDEVSGWLDAGRRGPAG